MRVPLARRQNLACARPLHVNAFLSFAVGPAVVGAAPGVR